VGPIPRGTALHAQALRITRRLEETEAALGRTLDEIRESRTFATLWFRDLEDYASKALGIDPARTQDLVRRYGACRTPFRPRTGYGHGG